MEERQREGETEGEEEGKRGDCEGCWVSNVRLGRCREVGENESRSEVKMEN